MADVPLLRVSRAELDAPNHDGIELADERFLAAVQAALRPGARWRAT